MLLGKKKKKKKSSTSGGFRNQVGFGEGGEGKRSVPYENEEKKRQATGKINGYEYEYGRGKKQYQMVGARALTDFFSSLRPDSPRRKKAMIICKNNLPDFVLRISGGG